MSRSLRAVLGSIVQWRARRALARCDSLGSDANVVGVPVIRNEGRIDIGEALRLDSSPVPLHFVVGPGGQLRIGDRVRIEHAAGIACCDKITIGSDTEIGPFTLLMDTDYHVPGQPSAQAQSAPISIGNNVKIGSRVVILRGSEIGDNVTIADRSVVAGSIPAGESVAGVPARSETDFEECPASLSGGARTVLEQVLEIAQRIFRLQQPPAADTGPASIPAWDSLGCLSLLMALEEQFEVLLDESLFAGGATLADAAVAIDRALLESMTAPQIPE